MVVEAVVKLGGSLIREGLLERNLEVLDRLSEKHGIVVVLGGGEIADAVRSFDSRYGLPDSEAHWKAVEAMEMNAEMAAGLLDRAETVETPGEAASLAGTGSIPFLLPSTFLREIEHEQSWELTSDSIAALAAEELDAGKTVVVTDVDGIFKDGELLEEAGIQELDEMDETCVDSLFPGIVERSGVPAAVVSGRHPERTVKAVQGDEFRGTKIC